MTTKVGTSYNFLQNQLLNAAIHNNNGAPSSPVNGQVYYDTGTNKLGCYCNGTWARLKSCTTAIPVSCTRWSCAYFNKPRQLKKWCKMFFCNCGVVPRCMTVRAGHLSRGC